MKNLFIMLFLSAFGIGAFTQEYQSDVFETDGGQLEITFIAHGTLMMQYNDMVIHVDPVSMFGTDYSAMPDADLILITHAHGDHLDPEAIGQLQKENTEVIVTAEVAGSLGFGQVLGNGEQENVSGITVESVPAYNLESAYHPKGQCNGYVLNFDGTKIYVAGDTENVPEMGNMEDIHVAFIPMNRPYTMTPAMAADAARMIHPDIIYPYHYGETDPQELVSLLNGDDIEVRVRAF